MTNRHDTAQTPETPVTQPVMRNSLDTALRERAARVIPGGMWGHQKATQLPEGYPQFFARGEGAKVWDVDGTEYVDFMCSWRSEEHTSELQSLMRISYAVFCLITKKAQQQT